MDKEMEDLLQNLGKATTREHDFEKTKLKVVVHLISAIYDLASEIRLFTDTIKDCHNSDNKCSKSQNTI